MLEIFRSKKLYPYTHKHVIASTINLHNVGETSVSVSYNAGDGMARKAQPHLAYIN